MVTLAEIPSRLSDDTRDGRLYAYIGALLARGVSRQGPLDAKLAYTEAVCAVWDSLSPAERNTITQAQHLTINAVEGME